MKRYAAEGTLLLIAVFWGGTFPVTKVLVEGISANYLIMLRFGLAFLVMAPFIRKRSSGSSAGQGGRRRLLISGVLLGVVLWGAYALQTIGLQYTSASKAGFITGLSVLMVPPMAAFLLKERPAAAAVIGAALATVGMGLLSVDFSVKYFIQPADLLVLGCAFLYALQIILIDKFTSQLDPTRLAWIEIGTVAVLAGVVAIWLEPVPQLDAKTWIGIAYLAVLATAFAQTAQVVVQRFTTPTRVALLLSLEPVFAALFAGIFLAEVLTWYQVVGGLLVLASILLAEINPWGDRNV